MGWSLSGWLLSLVRRVWRQAVVLSKTLWFGRTKVTGFALLLLIVTMYPALRWTGFPLVESGEPGPEAKNWWVPFAAAWFTLSYLLYPLLFVLFTFSVMHETRRLGERLRWKTGRGGDSLRIGFLWCAVALLDVLSWQVTHWVWGEDWGSVRELCFRTGLVPLGIGALAMVFDRLRGRRFTATPGAIVFVVVAQIGLGVGWLARGRWPIGVEFARVPAVLASSLILSVLICFGLFLLTLWPLRRAAERVASPTRGLQFRYIKAVTVLAFASLLIYATTLWLSRSLSFDEGIHFRYFHAEWDAGDYWADHDGMLRLGEPDQTLDAYQYIHPEWSHSVYFVDPVDLGVLSDREREERSTLRRLYNAGLAWVLSIPLVYFASALVGLLFVQDVSRDRWSRVQHSSASSGIRARLKAALRCFSEDVGVAIAAVSAIIYRSPLQCGFGLSMNVFFSLYPALFTEAEPLALFGIKPASGEVLNQVVIFNLWTGSFLLWAGPLVAGITDLHGTLRSGVEVNIARSLSRAEEHIVVAGYGDLSRRVIFALFRRKVLDFEHYRDSWDLVLPGGHWGRLVQGVIVVEVDQGAFELTCQVGNDTVGLIHLDPVPFQDESVAAGVPPYVLGVCGNVNDRHVLKASRLAYAENVLCLARDTDAVYSVSDYLRWNSDSRDVSGVFGAQSSSVPAFLGYRSFEWPVSYVHIAQSSAGALAQTIVHVAESRSLRFNEGAQRILFLGAGEEAFYILDSILKAAGRRAPRLLRRRFFIHSDESCFEARLIPEEKGRHAKMHRKGWRSVYFDPHLSQMDAVSPWPNREKGVQGWARLHWRKLNPVSDSTLLGTLLETRPDIVLVTDLSTTRQLRIIKAAVNGIALMREATSGDTKPLPSLVIGAETGRPGRADNIGDAAGFFYRRNHAHLGEQLYSYPRQFGGTRHRDHSMSGDMLVDVLDDPAYRVAGMLQAHKRPSPVELSLCLRSGSGVLASIMCTAAGLYAQPASHDFKDKSVPSLGGTRMFVGRESRHYILGSATLRKPEKRADQDVTPVRRASLLPLGQTDLRLEQIGGSYFKGLSHTASEDRSDESWWCKNCPDMASCPVANQRRSAETRLTDGEPSTRPYYWLASGAGDVTDEPLEQEESASARLLAVSESGLDAGVIAVVLSALVFRRCIRDVSVGDKRLNFIYASDEPCHNSLYSVVMMYGNLEDAASGSASSKLVLDRLPLTDLVVRPVGDEKRWLKYTKAVARFIRSTFVEGTPVPRLYVAFQPSPKTGNLSVPVLMWLHLGTEDETFLEAHKAGDGKCDLCTHSGPCRLCSEVRAALHGGAVGGTAQASDIEIRRVYY